MDNNSISSLAKSHQSQLCQLTSSALRLPVPLWPSTMPLMCPNCFMGYPMLGTPSLASCTTVHPLVQLPLWPLPPFLQFEERPAVCPCTTLLYFWLDNKHHLSRSLQLHPLSTIRDLTGRQARSCVRVSQPYLTTHTFPPSFSH